MHRLGIRPVERIEQRIRVIALHVDIDAAAILISRILRSLPGVFVEACLAGHGGLRRINRRTTHSLVEQTRGLQQRVADLLRVEALAREHG